MYTVNGDHHYQWSVNYCIPNEQACSDGERQEDELREEANLKWNNVIF